MKKICLLLIAALLLGCLAACQGTTDGNQATEPPTIENADGTLSDGIKRQIEDSYIKWTAEEFGPWYDEGDMYGARYYGTENGYIILYVDGNVSFGTDYQRYIGQHCFYKFDGRYFFLIAYNYKNGVIELLDEVYMQGLISDSAIKAAMTIHSKCEDEWREYIRQN